MGDGLKLNVFGKLCIKLFNQLFYCNFNLLFYGNQTKINCFSFPLYSLLLFNRKLTFIDDVWTMDLHKGVWLYSRNTCPD